MTPDNAQAAQFGLLVMYAMDMFTGMKGKTSLVPPADPRVTDAGWTITGYLTAVDAIYHPQTTMGFGDEVYYGFLAQNGAGECVVVIRGTNGIIEWVEDAEFVPVPYPCNGAMKVEQGFWGIYASMRLRDPHGNDSGPAAQGIVAAIGGRRITVVGHSLGSALATYLTVDLAVQGVGQNVVGCFFASPRTGDAAFVALFDAKVAQYRLFNYALDVVPQVPFGPDYKTLSRVTHIMPPGLPTPGGTISAEASIRVDVGCNHHVICYCAMLDYKDTPYQHVPEQDVSCAACIIGPAADGPSIATTMVKLLRELP